MQRSSYAFSLVELSIVLVILGLLVGGVLSGQSLIRAAELRSITTDMTRYLAAINTFKGKYFALPGDMNNATQFWGTLNAVPGTCADTQATGKATCNGDGSGYIGDYNVPASSMGRGAENLRAWQHLANAELIEGNFPGSDDDFDDAVTIGTSVPKSRIGNAGYSFIDDGSQLGDYRYTGSADGRDYLNFGSPTDGYSTGWGAIKPEEAWNIDTKIDDGKPGMGKMRASAGGVGCASTLVASTSVYVLTTTTNVCGFGIQF